VLTRDALLASAGGDVDQSTANVSHGTVDLFSARGLDAEIMLTIVPPSLL